MSNRFNHYTELIKNLQGSLGNFAKSQSKLSKIKNRILGKDIRYKVLEELDKLTGRFSLYVVKYNGKSLRDGASPEYSIVSQIIYDGNRLDGEIYEKRDKEFATSTANTLRKFIEDRKNSVDLYIGDNLSNSIKSISNIHFKPKVKRKSLIEILTDTTHEIKEALLWTPNRPAYAYARY